MLAEVGLLNLSSRRGCFCIAWRQSAQICGARAPSLPPSLRRIFMGKSLLLASIPLTPPLGPGPSPLHPPNRTLTPVTFVPGAENGTNNSASHGQGRSHAECDSQCWPCPGAQGSQRRPSPGRPGVSHVRNPVASLGNYASQVKALNHNNRGSLFEGSLSRRRGGEVGGTPPLHGCSGEFPLTALFSASGEEENSQHNTGSTNLKTGHGLRTDNIRWVPGGTPGQQSKSQEDASSRGPLQHVKFKAIISLFLLRQNLK